MGLGKVNREQNLIIYQWWYGYYCAFSGLWRILLIDHSMVLLSQHVAFTFSTLGSKQPLSVSYRVLSDANHCLPHIRYLCGCGNFERGEISEGVPESIMELDSRANTERWKCMCALAHTYVCVHVCACAMGKQRAVLRKLKRYIGQ